MLAERQRVEKEIQRLNEELEKLPEGKLLCSRNGRYHKWYQTDGKNEIYIPKRDRQLAEQLAMKHYLSLLKEDMQKEKTAIDSYLKLHGLEKTKSEQLLLSNSEYRNLLSPNIQPISKENLAWMNFPYDKNNKYTDKLIHKGYSGNLLRSKSEVLIDMHLFMNKIPFRYECALELGDIVVYPDFTIRHPKTGQIMYWEHFGMMDVAEYAKKTFSKLQLYNSHGIVPSIQLITTYETKDNPLNAEMVENLVRYYFL